MAIAETSLEEEREWLEEHPQEMSDDECEIIKYLLKLREQMDGDDYSLDGVRLPKFVSLPGDERAHRGLEVLANINAERQALLESVKSSTENLGDNEEDEEVVEE